MRRSPRGMFFVAFLLLVLGPTSALAQRPRFPNAPLSLPTNSPTDVPVFRTETRIVLVDVVATDSSGKAIHDLKPEEFQVLENGKAQRIRSFDEHAAPKTVAPLSEQPPHVAPGVYTNWTPKPVNSAVNIVLFDTLNTDFPDQAFARMKMVEYLKTLPPGQQVALYTLGTHLRIVQGFTGSSDILIAAAKKLGSLSAVGGSEKSGALADQAGLQLPPEASGAEAYSQAESLQYSAPPGTDSTLHFASATLQMFLNEQVNALRDMRIRMTLESLRELARSLGAIPGRKNLIWVSGNFPALMGSYTERSGFQAYNHQIRATAALLAATQIAVYPVDARGLLTQGVGDASIAGSAVIATGDGRLPYSRALETFSRDMQATYDAMDDIAEQTGGRAFHGTNDLVNAIGTSIDSGANYYTLAYAPTNKTWDGQLRKIEVKINRPNVKLMYRRGYYALADPFAPVLDIKTTKVDVQRRLIEAIQPNSPQAADVLVMAKTSTPIPDKPIQIDYVIDANNLTLTPGENGGRTVRYQLAVVAWDDDKNAAQAWEMVDKEITAPQAATILHGGIASHRFLTLKPGNYRLSLGIIDVESKKIGTLTIPLKVPNRVHSPDGPNLPN